MPARSRPARAALSAHVTPVPRPGSVRRCRGAGSAGRAASVSYCSAAAELDAGRRGVREITSDLRRAAAYGGEGTSQSDVNPRGGGRCTPLAGRDGRVSSELDGVRMGSAFWVSGRMPRTRPACGLSLIRGLAHRQLTGLGTRTVADAPRRQSSHAGRSHLLGRRRASRWTSTPLVGAGPRGRPAQRLLRPRVGPSSPAGPPLALDRHPSSIRRLDTCDAWVAWAAWLTAQTSPPIVLPSGHAAETQDDIRRPAEQDLSSGTTCHVASFAQVLFVCPGSDQEAREP